MQIQKGSVVKSMAGHDSGRFYLVLSVEGDFAFIADGKVRKYSAPKKKRLKHLAPTNTVLDTTELINDKRLNIALQNFNR